ncbi:MAG: protein kinase, partial [Myxococcales bacterium]|nr:protein kinase [Myxococcales bacterium]
MRGPQRTRDEAWIGKTLDQRYKILEVFSETPTHTVFVAQHLRLRKQVAIKIIQPEYASDGEIAARFAREAMAGAQFDHPNVVGIIDCGRLGDGRTFLVTELVRGMTLGEFLATHGRMHWTLACDIAAQLAEALIAAHGVGIVHRDVNPEHLILEVRDDGS